MDAESQTTAAEHRLESLPPPRPDPIRGGGGTTDRVTRVRRLVRRFEHLVKYLFIGSMASAIDVGLFLGLHNIAGFKPLAAHSVSVPTSVVFSFTCNALHNFRTTDWIALRFASFITVAIIGYLIGAVVIAVVHGGLGLSANIAKVLSLPLVFVVQYLLNSRLSFRKTEAASR